ncbi:MAG: hypothetical protein JOS17DRAFT_788830 [Linnemannia elongata]|nr:MAG: hypothetical protein JOS17DRAFT_788830 [Linnemannia elongata]
MSLFKRSNKNKTASAASTPAQTPRTSMQTIRDATGTKMTPEEALYKISHNMMTNASTVLFPHSVLEHGNYGYCGKMSWGTDSRSNKNKSASAASSPAQTPRASMQSSRSSDTKLTHEQAIYKIAHNKLTFAAAGVCVR